MAAEEVAVVAAAKAKQKKRRKKKLEKKHQSEEAICSEVVTMAVITKQIYLRMLVSYLCQSYLDLVVCFLRGVCSRSLLEDDSTYCSDRLFAQTSNFAH